MSIPVVINGITYQQPIQGTPSPWGSVQAAIVVALASSCLQKTGGTFTLSAEADFGISYGLKSIYFKSRTTNPASAGPIRLANNEGIAWRNAANLADVTLKLNASNLLEIGGSEIATFLTVSKAEYGYLSGVTSSIQTQLGNKITNPMTADGDLITQASGVPAAIPKGTDGLVLKMISGAPAWGSLSGVGDVVGPASAVYERIAVYNSTTGKIIKDGGAKISDLLANPMSADGDMVVRSGGVPERLPKGTDGYSLQMVAGLPSWSVPPPRIKRPGYQYANAVAIVVPASAGSPAVVLINGIYYTNTSNETLQTTIQGRGGRDTISPTAAMSYLYAIPAVSGTTFNLVCSSAAPPTGPTGFANWSYLGAFITDGANGVFKCFASNGKYIHISVVSVTHTGDTNWTAVSIAQPTTIKFALGNIASNAVAAGYVSGVSGFSNPPNFAYLVVIPQVAGLGEIVFGEVPMPTPGTIYLYTQYASNTSTFTQFGWIEDPTEFL